jgi:hypothetical protein
MIPRRPAPDLIRGVQRFPACAKPVAWFSIRLDASAGEGRSEKIMLKQTSASVMTIRRKVITL